MRRDTAHTFMWNDRDCNASNYFVCERPQSVDRALQHALHASTRAHQAATNAVHGGGGGGDADTGDWTATSSAAATTTHQSGAGPNDGDGFDGSAAGAAGACNRTVRLSRERQRAHISSPGYPYEYADNTNCFTVVLAPAGYSVVLEFEEFVLEAEPECTYDFVEIVDTMGKWQRGAAAGAESDRRRVVARKGGAADAGGQTGGAEQRTENDVYPEAGALSPHTLRSLYMKYMTQQQREQRSLPKVPWETGSGNNMNSNHHNNNTAYEQFLDAYAALRRTPTDRGTVVLRIPAHGTANTTALFEAAKARPHRVCGDWNAKLKLLRYTSVGPVLGLRFSSDYSHHRSGFKARVMLKNGEWRGVVFVR